MFGPLGEVEFFVFAHAIADAVGKIFRHRHDIVRTVRNAGSFRITLAGIESRVVQCELGGRDPHLDLYAAAMIFVPFLMLRICIIFSSRSKVFDLAGEVAGFSTALGGHIFESAGFAAKRRRFDRCEASLPTSVSGDSSQGTNEAKTGDNDTSRRMKSHANFWRLIVLRRVRNYACLRRYVELKTSGG